MEWKPITIDEVFTIEPGKRLEKRNMTDGARPFIGASDSNNGVTAFVGNTNESLDHNVLGINYNGSICEAFYHPYECVFTDDVKRLHLRDVQDNRDLLLFVGRCIRQQKRKYEYAYKFNEQRMKRQSIVFPADDDGSPDWEYMSSYTEAMRQSLLERYMSYVTERISELEYQEIPNLDEVEWAVFHIGELFDVKRPAARSKDDYKDGDVPFVASGAANNGVMKCCVPKEGEQLDKGGCITVSPVDGSSFYQPMEFLGRGGAGSSILMLYNERVSEWSGQFIARMVRQTCSKYTYGHMGNKDSIKREAIQLPLASDGKPDYVYMEQYVKNMMLKKYQQFLDYVK